MLRATPLTIGGYVLVSIKIRMTELAFNPRTHCAHSSLKQPARRFGFAHDGYEKPSFDGPVR